MRRHGRPGIDGDLRAGFSPIGDSKMLITLIINIKKKYSHIAQNLGKQKKGPVPTLVWQWAMRPGLGRRAAALH
jgi:hypothetical protein